MKAEEHITCAKNELRMAIALLMVEHRETIRDGYGSKPKLLRLAQNALDALELGVPTK